MWFYCAKFQFTVIDVEVTTLYKLQLVTDVQRQREVKIKIYEIENKKRDTKVKRETQEKKRDTEEKRVHSQRA